MSNRISRRTFIKLIALGTGGAMTGTVLAACSSAAPVATTPTSAPSPTAEPSPTPAPATAQPEPAAAPPKLRFPDGFLWGVATSAYQIEGAASEDGRGESVWDRFSHTPGKTRNGDTGDVANDHYHRYAQDLDLIKSLGVQTYRFSISWPRVLPSGAGAVNQKGLDFYRRLVEGLLERGIQPMATLFHWDTPQALQDQGGWERRDTALRFAEYADVVFRAIGDRVPLWLTLNEPKTVVMVGYVYGAHAPGLRAPERAFSVLHHMLLGHGLAVQAFRASSAPGAQIGPALNLAPTYPAEDGPGAQAAALLHDGYENRLYLDPVLRGSYPDDALRRFAPGDQSALIKPGDLAVISAPNDLLAVNYYNPIYVRADGQVVPGPHPRSVASWQEIYPEGLYDTLTRLKRDYGDLPLYITENGMPADDRPDASGQIDDAPRIRFLYDHIAAAQRAIGAGVNLRGYYVWSLMDNFEWAEGYSQRWGIVYVDFATQRRTPKRSALWYREVVQRNGLGEPVHSIPK